MATSADLRRIALSLSETTEAPHFDRVAFKVARIYVTLAADGKTANFKFTTDEQEFKCLTSPEAFAALIKSDIAKFATLIKTAGVTPQ